MSLRLSRFCNHPPINHLACLSLTWMPLHWASDCMRASRVRPCSSLLRLTCTFHADSDESVAAGLVSGCIAIAVTAGVRAAPCMRCRQGQRAQLHSTSIKRRANPLQLATVAGGGGDGRRRAHASSPGTQLDSHGLSCWRARFPIHAMPSRAASSATWHEGRDACKPRTARYWGWWRRS